MDNQSGHDSPMRDKHLEDLTVQVLAAEVQLTHFASRSGKTSPEYQSSLRDFATAWFLLKKNRDNGDFHEEVSIS